jgi:iron complex transport system substrate-binding protein
MNDMTIPRPAGSPDTTKSIFVPLFSEQILDADAALVMVSAYIPDGGP